MITNQPQWRLRMDRPQSFAVSPGYVRATHAHDLRDADSTFSGTYRDPLTGLVMLQPSFLTEKFYGSSFWRPLSNWLFDPTFWRSVNRGSDPDGMTTANLFGSVSPSGGDGLYGIAITGAIADISLASAFADDAIIWSMQSSFTLARDEGFVWNYHTLGDNLDRHRNWFALQWDNIGIHFSFDGTVRVYLFEEDKTIPPTLFETFEIAYPGDIIHKDGYFIFVPIPGHGLALYHSRSAQKLPNRVSSAQAGVTRGHLIALPRRVDEDGKFYVHDGGTFTAGIAKNITRFGQVFGYHQIHYPASGTFTEPVFDPGYRPTVDPTTVSATLVPAANGSATAVLRNATDSAAWTAGTDRQGRVKLTLSSADSRFTPFVLGSFTFWEAIHATRATTEVAPDALYYLEFSDDELGRFEGSCTVLMKGDAQRKIVERGDATFVVEKRFMTVDEGDNPIWGEWEVHNGGLAHLASETEAHMDEAGMYYIAHWQLKGMEARFEEVHQTFDSAFDALSVGESINQVLAASAFEPLASIPSEADAVKFPKVPKGQNYRFAPRFGDSGDKIINDLLFYLRRYHEEWRLRFDWPTQKWILEKKPRSTATLDTWTLTPFEDEVDVAARKLPFGSGGTKLFNVFAEPPEFNVLFPFGCTSPDPSGKRVPVTPIKNAPSLTDTTSVDYLGRAKYSARFFAPLEDKERIRKAGAIVFDAGAHRRLRVIVEARDYVDDFKPVLQTKVRAKNAAGTRADLFTLWLKRRSVVLDYNAGGGDLMPQITYTLDSVWESEIEK